jgi:hypothetical protein
MQTVAESATPAERGHAPEQLLCPISRDVMEDPVVADNQTYERVAIQDWVDRKARDLDEVRKALTNCDSPP